LRDAGSKLSCTCICVKSGLAKIVSLAMIRFMLSKVVWWSNVHFHLTVIDVKAVSAAGT
jgi:hypothetical protein